MSKVLLNAEVITPFQVRKESVIVIENEKIKELGNKKNVKYSKNSEIHDLAGKYVVPGFIDLHVHGIAGNDFSEPAACDFEKITNSFLSHGITGILITLIPKPKKELIKDIRFYTNLISKLKKPNIICGLHLEGPFLNKKMHGAIHPDSLWTPDFDDWCSLYEASLGNLKLMTIAPELPG